MNAGDSEILKGLKSLRTNLSGFPRKIRFGYREITTRSWSCIITWFAVPKQASKHGGEVDKLSNENSVQNSNHKSIEADRRTNLRSDIDSQLDGFGWFDQPLEPQGTSLLQRAVEFPTARGGEKRS